MHSRFAIEDGLGSISSGTFVPRLWLVVGDGHYLACLASKSHSAAHSAANAYLDAIIAVSSRLLIMLGWL